MEKPLTYYNNFFSILYAQRIVANCAEIAFYNAGTATVLIAGVFPILPGALLSFDGKAGEFDTTSYTVSFTGAGTLNCIAIRKYYQNSGSTNTFNLTGTIKL